MIAPDNEIKMIMQVQAYSGSQNHTTRRGRASCSINEIEIEIENGRASSSVPIIYSPGGA